MGMAWSSRNALSKNHTDLNIPYYLTLLPSMPLFILVCVCWVRSAQKSCFFLLLFKLWYSLQVHALANMIRTKNCLLPLSFQSGITSQILKLRHRITHRESTPHPRNFKTEEYQREVLQPYRVSVGPIESTP